MRIAFPLAICLILCACKPSTTTQSVAKSDEPQVPEFDNEPFPDAIRLTNGTVSLVIVPSIGGRIMHYGMVGGDNVLWNNPAIHDATKNTDGSYFNYGGDKAWPWPQDDWPLLIGRSYPPPPECNEATFKSRLIGSNGVRLESPVIASHAARIVREIMLDPTGTRVTIVTHLEQAGGARPPASMAAWTVTQVPGDRDIYARMIPDGVFESMRPQMPTPTSRPIDPKNARVIALAKTTPNASKTGLDADTLAAVKGDTLFVIRSQTAAMRTDKFHPAERGQLFIQQADPPKEDTPRYIELEFTGPREDLATGQPAELRVIWELKQQEKGWTDKSIAAFLLNDTPEPANRRPAIGVP